MRRDGERDFSLIRKMLELMYGYHYQRLITLYQTIYDALYAKSGQTGPLKLQYIKTKHEAVLGWVRRHQLTIMIAL